MSPKGFCYKCGYYEPTLTKFVEYTASNNRIGLILLNELIDGIDVGTIRLEAERLPMNDYFRNMSTYIHEKPERIYKLRDQLHEYLEYSKVLADRIREVINQAHHGKSATEYSEGVYSFRVIVDDSRECRVTVSPFPSSFKVNDYLNQERIVFLTSTDYEMLKDWQKSHEVNPKWEWIILTDSSYYVFPTDVFRSETYRALISKIAPFLKSSGFVQVTDLKEELELERKGLIIHELASFLQRHSFDMRKYGKVIIAIHGELEKVLYIHLATSNDPALQYNVPGIVMKLEQFQSYVDKTIDVWINPPIIDTGSLNQEVLTRYGWHAYNEEEDRHSALSRAEGDVSVGHIQKILNWLISTWRNHPYNYKYVEVVTEDLDWFYQQLRLRQYNFFQNSNQTLSYK